MQKWMKGLQCITISWQTRKPFRVKIACSRVYCALFPSGTKKPERFGCDRCACFILTTNDIIIWLWSTTHKHRVLMTETYLKNCPSVKGMWDVGVISCLKNSINAAPPGMTLKMHIRIIGAVTTRLLES